MSINITEHEVDKFIKNFKTYQQEAFWDGYSLIIWRKTPLGFFDIHGMFRNNHWGIAKSIPVNDQGLWEIPQKYVDYITRTRP